VTVASERIATTQPVVSGGVLRLRVSTAVEIVLLAVLLFLAAAMRMVNTGEQGGDLDEGVHGMQLLLMQAGYRPFQEIYAAQGPLMLDVLFPLFQAYGGSLTAARLAVGTYSLVGIAGAYWVGRLAAGPIAGLTAALLLTLSPTYLRNSRQALAEAVALGPAVVAVGAALAYQRSGRRSWLVLAAVLLVLSLLIKPITIAAVVPVGLAILLRRKTGPRDLLLFGGVGSGLTLLVLLTLGFGGVIDQLVEYRMRAREAQSWKLHENLSVLRETLGRDQLALFGMAAVGGVAALARAPRVVLPLAAWVLAAGAFLLFYSPLFPKHAATALPPVAILAAVGLASFWVGAFGMGRWGDGEMGRRPRVGHVAQVGRVAAVLSVGWYLTTLPTIVGWDLRFTRIGPGNELPRFSETSDAVRSISVLTQPGDFVLTDHPFLPLLAQRLVPPPLGDPSKTRVRSRELTGAEIAAAATEYPSKIAVLWSDRFRPLRGFRAWLSEQYQLAKIYGHKGDSPRTIYMRRDMDLEQARTALARDLEARPEVEFGRQLRLAAFGLQAKELPAGGATGITIEWQAVERLATEYHVILKLVGADGQVWDDEELSLVDRGETAVDWPAGRWVFQVSTIALPPEAPAGLYSVVVSLYDTKNRRLAPVTAPGPGGQEELRLAELTVRAQH
jgi:hypothetical protein